MAAAVDNAAKEQNPGTAAFSPRSSSNIFTEDDTKKQTDNEKNAAPLPAGVPDPPPNGDLVTWLQVAAGFTIFFNTWGMINTFAVFQTFYESGVLFKESSSNISWIGSLQCFLLQFAGLIAGPVYDRGYLRLLLVTGGFLIVFGFMMLSLATEFWQVALAQAFCISIGAGLLFTPTVALLPTYFTTRIGLAIGIATSGSSLGGVIYPISLNRLIPEVGFLWAVRIIGFIALAAVVLPLLVMRVRIRSPKPRALIDWSAFQDPPFKLFTLRLLITFIGNAVLTSYISFYPANRGFTDTSLAFYMVAIFNAASVFGRIAPSALSD